MNCKFLRGITTTKKYISITLSTLTLLTCLTGCGDKKESKEDNKIQIPREASTAAPVSPSAAELSTPVETVDEPEYGIIKHTDREYEGYYLEDYMTLEFKGYEHDSDCEVIVDWDKIAKDLGNGVTPEILEAVYQISVLNTDENTLDRTKINDLVNGDEVTISMYENTLQDTFKQKYTKELKYIDENLWYYEKTPVIVYGLKTKVFIENTSDIDKTAIQKVTDEKMNEIKDSAKDYVSDLDNDYAARSIMLLYNWKLDVMGNTHNCKINDFTIDKTYFAKRTASSYNDTTANSLPENMVFNIYKLSVERYGTGEILDLYYRTEIGNLLYDDDKMVISDDTVKVQFAGTAEELMPDSKYWDIVEVK